MPLCGPNGSHGTAEPLITDSHHKTSLLNSQHTNYGAVDGYQDTSILPEEEPLSKDVDAEPPIDPQVWRRAMFAMPGLAIGLFLASADQTIVISSYSKIGDELKALNQTSWIATMYV